MGLDEVHTHEWKPDDGGETSACLSACLTIDNHLLVLLIGRCLVKKWRSEREVRAQDNNKTFLSFLPHFLFIT
jgi:hypothetical protein